MRSIWQHRDLVLQLAERDTRSRYRSSAAGLLWAVLSPLLMLCIYTVFFGEVFPAKWNATVGGRADFALILFVGLMLHGFVAELIVRAPTMIVAQANFVRKVIFPLELLPVVALGTALVHLALSLAVWLGVYVVLRGLPPVTVLWLPVIVLPLALLTLGICWFVAALAVYLRDVAHVMPMVATVLLFASPIFYPLSALPPDLAAVVALGPLTVPVEMARNAMLWGQAPPALLLAGYYATACIVAALGFAWFQATRKGFADVL